MWELFQLPAGFLPAETAPLFVTHNYLVMQNLSNGQHKCGKKKQQGAKFMYRNETLELRREETGESGRRLLYGRGLGGFFK